MNYGALCANRKGENAALMKTWYKLVATHLETQPYPRGTRKICIKIRCRDCFI